MTRAQTPKGDSPDGLATVAWLNPDGSAGFLDERRRVVSVKGVIPGDQISWRPLKENKRAVSGEVLAITSSSPARQVPPCPDHDGCGGCDLAHLETASRHHYQQRMVQKALRLPEAPPLTPSPLQTGHRARIKLAIQDGKVGYRAARSHTLCAFTQCHISRRELDAPLSQLRDLVRQVPDFPAHEVELRTDGAKVVCAFQSRAGYPNTELREALKALEHVSWNGKTLHGDGWLTLEVEGVALRAGPRTFYQVNLEANRLLVGDVVRQILEISPERVLDLYSGIGNFTLPLADRGIPVVAVEREGQSISDLDQVISDRGYGNIKTLAISAEKFDPSREPFDAAVLDPPRAGTGKVLGRVLRNRPRRVVYVSCNLLSAVRDLKSIANQGYEVTNVHCYELFPETHHIETVITLDRM